MNKRVLEAYNNYRSREFETEPLESLPNIINLAYAETTDGKSEIQVCYDLEERRYKHYLNGACLSEIDCSLKQFIEDLKNNSYYSYIKSVWWLGIE